MSPPTVFDPPITGFGQDCNHHSYYSGYKIGSSVVLQ